MLLEEGIERENFQDHMENIHRKSQALGNSISMVSTMGDLVHLSKRTRQTEIVVGQQVSEPDKCAFESRLCHLLSV